MIEFRPPAFSPPPPPPPPPPSPIPHHSKFPRRALYTAVAVVVALVVLGAVLGAAKPKTDTKVVNTEQAIPVVSPATVPASVAVVSPATVPASVPIVAPAATPPVTIAEDHSLVSWGIAHASEASLTMSELSVRASAMGSVTNAGEMMGMCSSAADFTMKALIAPAALDPDVPAEWSTMLTEYWMGFTSCATGDFASALPHITAGTSAMTTLTGMIEEATAGL